MGAGISRALGIGVAHGLGASGRRLPPNRADLIAEYRRTITGGRLIAYRPPTVSTTPQVKGSLFSGAGTGACTGLTTAMVITTPHSDVTDGVDLWDNTPTDPAGWTLTSGWWVHSPGAGTPLYDIDHELIIGEMYKATIEVRTQTAGSTKIGFGTGFGPLITTDGIHTFIGICSGDTIIRASQPTADFAGEVRIISIQRLTQAQRNPTCTENGTLTIHGDCWDIRVYLGGVLWAYWPGINVIPPIATWTEPDASGNGHHLVLTTTTITERIDGTGTNYANEVGFSYGENLFDYRPDGDTDIFPEFIGDYLSLTKLTADAGAYVFIYALGYSPTWVALRTDYTAKLTLQKAVGATNDAVDLGWAGGGQTAQILSGPGSATISGSGLPQISGLSVTEDTIVAINKTNFVVGTSLLKFDIYPGSYDSTTIGDGCLFKDVHLCEGSYPDSQYAPPQTRWRVAKSSRGGYPQSLGTVVCIGDSLTLAYQAPIMLLHPLSTFIGAGTGGNTSADVLARFQADVINAGADHCILFVGINNVNRDESAAGIIADIAFCCDLASANGVSITLSELSPYGNSITEWTAPRQAVLEETNILINAYGAANGIRVVGLYDIMREPGTDNLAAVYDIGDGLHYSTLGIQTEAWAFAEALPVAYSADGLFRHPLTTPGPLNVSARVVSGVWPTAVIEFPLGPQFQAITEASNAADVNLGTRVNTPQSIFGPRYGLVYRVPLSAADLARAERYCGAGFPYELPFTLE